MRPTLTTTWLALVIILGLAVPGRAQTTSVAPDFPTTTTAPASTQASDTQAVQGGKAALVLLHGPIDDYTAKMLISRIEQARAGGARTVIIELNTPGGLASAAEDITRYLRSQNDLHIVAFVERWALSAGIMIGLAADELVMAPESKIGDSAPIAMTPG